MRAHSCCLFLPTRVCLDETDFFLIRLFENQLSMLKAKGPWRDARHLVEAPREVTLVGESSCEGDVNEREICVREQLLRAQ